MADQGYPEGATPKNPFWSQPARVWNSVMPVLERWTNMVLQNAPRVVRLDAEPQVLIECDASKWGYGCCMLNRETGVAHSFGGPWPHEVKQRFGEKLGESTFAEPFGVLLSLVKAREQFPEATRFGVTNDNSVAVVAFTRRFNSHSWGINECLRRADELFPQSEFSITMRKVAGVANMADGGSRGRVVNEMDGEQKLLLRSRWGSDVAENREDASA